MIHFYESIIILSWPLHTYVESTNATLLRDFVTATTPQTASRHHRNTAVVTCLISRLDTVLSNPSNPGANDNILQLTKTLGMRQVDGRELMENTTLKALKLVGQVIRQF